jgi:hypothetical protein
MTSLFLTVLNDIKNLEDNVYSHNKSLENQVSEHNRLLSLIDSEEGRESISSFNRANFKSQLLHLKYKLLDMGVDELLFEKGEGYNDAQID